MAKGVRLLVGTRKGLFLIDDEGGGARWRVSGPFCETWPINHAVADPETGAIYAAGGSEWFGPAVWRSLDGGASWTHSSAGLAYPEGEEPVKTVWSLAVVGSRLFAGVQPAGLSVSEDGGESFRELEGLRRHPSRPEWNPGGAGLILHGIVPHAEDPARMWVALSAVGVFHTGDGGETWEPRNRGVRQDYAPPEDRYPEFGQCVHCLVAAPGAPERLYQQNHCGMYRSEDGGRSWESVEAGLPSSFGFPAAAHPRDPDTLFLFPLNGDSAGRYAPEGRVAVWRTRDGGRSWADLREGLPQGGAFLTVLRQAMATDGGTPAGVYFGTTSGGVWASADEGEGWARIAEHLPWISSVEVAGRA